MKDEEIFAGLMVLFHKMTDEYDQEVLQEAAKRIAQMMKEEHKKKNENGN